MSKSFQEFESIGDYCEAYQKAHNDIFLADLSTTMEDETKVNIMKYFFK